MSGMTDEQAIEIVERAAKEMGYLIEPIVTMAAQHIRARLRVQAQAEQAAPVAGDAVARNPLLAYADSYRLMARIGSGKVDCLSVASDIERNMAPHAALAQDNKGT